jgi:hypothetical protein
VVCEVRNTEAIAGSPYYVRNHEPGTLASRYAVTAASDMP